MNATTLITGGTGKTGRRVAERLTARGVPVRVGSRSGEPPFDWQDPATWPAVLAGTEAIYLSYFPDVAFPGAADAIRALAEAAVERGVRRLVLLSGRGEPEAQRCEAIVRSSAVDWTIVQSSMFAQNFSEYFLLEPVRSGIVAFPAGDMAEPFIDVEDIADVAAAALTEDRHAGRLYEVTGPRLLTFAEAVAEISAAIGREVRYQPITPDEYYHALTTEGMPPDLATPVRDLFGSIFDGRNAYVADGVRQALGREPRDFRDYVRDAAATGVWG